MNMDIWKYTCPRSCLNVYQNAPRCQRRDTGGTLMRWGSSSQPVCSIHPSAHTSAWDTLFFQAFFKCTRLSSKHPNIFVIGVPIYQISLWEKTLSNWVHFLVLHLQITANWQFNMSGSVQDFKKKFITIILILFYVLDWLYLKGNFRKKSAKYLCKYLIEVFKKYIVYCLVFSSQTSET